MINDRMVPYLWPQAASGPQAFTSDLAPQSTMSTHDSLETDSSTSASTAVSGASARWRSSLLPQAVPNASNSSKEPMFDTSAERQSSLLPQGPPNGSNDNKGRRNYLLADRASNWPLGANVVEQGTRPCPPAPASVWLSQQQQFDQALMQTSHGIARCVRSAMQGVGEQRRDPVSEESLVAAYTVARHFGESMRIPMQDSSDLLLRCTPPRPEVPRNHLGYLHAAVRVVDGAWTDDAGAEAMESLLEALGEAGVQPPNDCPSDPLDSPQPDFHGGVPSQLEVPAPAPRLRVQVPPDGVPCNGGTAYAQGISQLDPPRGDPSRSEVPATALRLGDHAPPNSVPADQGTPN